MKIYSYYGCICQSNGTVMQTQNLPTDLLRTFVTVTDLGGYTRAAESLGRTQPAISLQMRRLEKIVGTTLITQKGRTFQLTEQGETLSRYAREILRLNDEAIGRFHPATATGVIRVGLPTDFAVAYLQRALTEFSMSHDDIDLEIRCDLSRVLLDALHRDDLDIVAGAFGDMRQGAAADAAEPVDTNSHGHGRCSCSCLVRLIGGRPPAENPERRDLAGC